MTRQPASERSLRIRPRKTGPISTWLGRECYEIRGPITVDLHRIIMWPNAAATGDPEVIGEPFGEKPQAQTPPKNGVGSRVAMSKIEKRLSHTEQAIVGFACPDGFPEFYPMNPEVEGDLLQLDSGDLPAGGRRAGILSDSFAEKLVGRVSAIMTRWLDVRDRAATCSPHTLAGYSLPENKFFFSSGGSFVAKLGYRKAVKEGLVKGRVW